jgi:hypothetical protein
MRPPTPRPAGHVGPCCTQHGVGTHDNAGCNFLRNLAAAHQAAASGVYPAEFVNNDVAGHAALYTARHQPTVYLDSAAVPSFFPSANVFEQPLRPSPPVTLADGQRVTTSGTATAVVRHARGLLRMPSSVHAPGLKSFLSSPKQRGSTTCFSKRSVRTSCDKSQPRTSATS